MEEAQSKTKNIQKLRDFSYHQFSGCMSNQTCVSHGFFLSQQRTHRTAKNPGHHVSPLNSVREGRGKRWRSRRIGPNVPNLQNYTENEHWTYDIPTEPFVSLVQRAKTHIWLCVMAPGTDQFFFFFFSDLVLVLRCMVDWSGSRWDTRF